MPTKRPTLKDVARVAKVHYSTVSLALREHPSIPEHSRRRIRCVAEKIGYVADPAMAALSRFRRQSHSRAEVPRIAYLLNQTPEKAANPRIHHFHLLEGACERARVIGFDLEPLFVAEDHIESEQLEAELREREVHGIVIGSFEPGYAGLALDWDRYAVVKIDSQHMSPAAVFVSNDQLQITRLAFQRMAALGYRRIGLAVGRANEDGTNYRHVSGWLIEQAMLPAEARVPPLLFPYNPSKERVIELLGRWVARHGVDAVLCNWDGVEELLTMARLRVPEDVACACLCLYSPGKREAGVLPHLGVVGAKAVSLLAAQLRAGQRGIPAYASVTYVQGCWQDGATAPGRR